MFDARSGCHERAPIADGDGGWLERLKVARALATLWLLFPASSASAHDIYTDLENPTTHGPCCNSKIVNPVKGDCRPTLAKYRGNVVSYWVDQRWWVDVPASQVIFMNIPGEEGQVHPNMSTPPEDGMVWAHFCGRQYSVGIYSPHTMNGWNVFCAFYPPGST
jgi:hypothetical protein